MRRFAFIFLLFPIALSAQEDCELFNLQSLTAEIQTLRAENDLLSCYGGVEMDGYRYYGVPIGDQCWFKENLRTTVFADGNAIPEVTDNTAWASLTTAARCDYENEATYVGTYGRLYNWYAVEDGRGLCPSGWHVPSDAEWTALESYITSQGFAGTEGTALKWTAGWNGSGNGTNDFGFSALPGGYRGTENSSVGVNDGDFANVGFEGNWWSPNVLVDIFSGERFDPSFWELSSGSAAIVGGQAYLQDGKSVRCLRDAD